MSNNSWRKRAVCNAYPLQTFRLNEHGRPEIDQIEHGLTIREHLAGQLLAALVTSGVIVPLECQSNPWARGLVKGVLDLADTLLQEMAGEDPGAVQVQVEELALPFDPDALVNRAMGQTQDPKQQAQEGGQS